MPDRIEESTEHAHMVAEGVPEDAARGAVGIDRTYKHLVKSGMEGVPAYAYATSTWIATCFDLYAMSPEAEYVWRQRRFKLSPAPDLLSLLLL